MSLGSGATDFCAVRGGHSSALWNVEGFSFLRRWSGAGWVRTKSSVCACLRSMSPFTVSFLPSALTLITAETRGHPVWETARLICPCPSSVGLGNLWGAYPSCICWKPPCQKSESWCPFQEKALQRPTLWATLPTVPCPSYTCFKQ